MNLKLLKCSNLVDIIKAIRIEDDVKLVDGLLYGYEGKIVKIDYRKQRAKVFFHLREFHVKVGLLVVLLIQLVSWDSYLYG